MYLFLIIVLGFILRLINIDRPEGLWNDEYVSWYVASTPFNEGFLQEILKQCHLPLYYLYLKPFTGFSDLTLRFSSLLPSIVSIYVMYLVGKEFSKKNAIITASITAILPFLIYYSQEVRFYSLLFLFSSLSLLFLIRVIKNNKGWLGYLISSSLILLTHVLGGIYVFLTFAYLMYKTKKINKNLLYFLLIFLILIVPLGINILKMLPTSQWWGHFSYTNILFLFSDYFSPILTNHINAPTNFIYSDNLFYNLLMILPTILGFYLLFKNLKRAKGLAIILLGVIFITALLALNDKIVFITKYTIEILPILILLISLDINKCFNIIITILFILFNLFSVFTPYYPTKNFRSEGHKLVCDILNENKSNYIVFTYYEPNRFLRYLNTNSKFKYISKINRFEYLKTPEKIFTEIKKGESVSVVFLDTVAFIPKDLINQAKKNNIPEMFITFSEIKNSLVDTLNDNFTNFDVKKNGSWIVIEATKLK